MRRLAALPVYICFLLATMGLAVVVFACDEQQSSGSPLEWHSSMDEAVAESKRTGKPILMEINGRPWCPPCNAQGEKIINHADFITWANDNVVLLDIKVGKGYDKDHGNPIWKEQMSKHNLPGIPAGVLIDQHGKTMGVVYPKEGVQQWLGAATNIITSHALRTDKDAQPKLDAVIPFRLSEWNNMSVPATLNNNIALNLMFHTAVGGLSLTQATLERFPEIKLDQSANVESWGGPSKSNFGTGVSLRIASLAAQQVMVFEDLHSGHNTNGKFGPEQLPSKLFAIDFDKSQIRLLSDLPSEISKWQELRMETVRGMMFVTATVHAGNKNAEQKFMIHSGYSGFALLDDAFATQHPFLNELEIIDESELTDSAGNKLKTQKIKLPKFTIADTTFEDAPVSFFSGAIGRQQYSVLGGDFLKRFNVIFDLESQRLFLKANGHSDSDYFQAD